MLIYFLPQSAIVLGGLVVERVIKLALRLRSL